MYPITVSFRCCTFSSSSFVFSHSTLSRFHRFGPQNFSLNPLRSNSIVQGVTTFVLTLPHLIMPRCARICRSVSFSPKPRNPMQLFKISTRTVTLYILFFFLTNSSDLTFLRAEYTLPRWTFRCETVDALRLRFSPHLAGFIPPRMPWPRSCICMELVEMPQSFLRPFAYQPGIYVSLARLGLRPASRENASIGARRTVTANSRN